MGIFCRASRGLPLLLLLAACTEETPPQLRQETVVFGTRVAVQIVGAPAVQAEAAANEVFARFADMHKRFHPWREGGELQRLNARIAAGALPVEVSAEMARMIAQAQVFSRHSEGVFDPGVGRLVQLWGFDAESPPTAPPSPPSEQAIAAVLAEGIGVGGLVLEGNRLVAAPRGVALDFGAQAKGVALDAARDILHKHGIRNALVDIGGNIMALGSNGSRPWRVALAPHHAASPVASVLLHDGEAVATSGGGERFFQHEGTRYSHIVDPRTGRAVQAHGQATVIADGEDAGAVSDMVATALVIAEQPLRQRLLARAGISKAWRTGSAPTAAMRQRLQESGVAAAVLESP